MFFETFIGFDGYLVSLFTGRHSFSLYTGYHTYDQSIRSFRIPCANSKYLK